MTNKLGLTKEEQHNINTICEYLFFDQFTGVATFLRFERCFQPLLSDDPNLDLENLFKELCGPKKKYLNYKRFVSAYLKYKEDKASKEVKNFFDKLFNSIFLKTKGIGTFEEGRLTFSTVRANGKRECLTLIEVLNDKEGVIHGMNLVFDEVFKNKLYPKKIEDSLSVGLEISLKILDEEKLEKRGISKYIKASYFRDAVTHIFGTVDQETGYITFLGFKCVSGKTQFVGFPKGKSFLMGDFGKKFMQIKCQMTSDGITTLLPYFDKNYRPNHYLTKKISQITLQELSKDEIILDEDYLAKLEDKNEIDKFITTALIDDTHFFNFKLKDDIFGNSLKEVIKKKPKKWMMQSIEKEKKKEIQKPKPAPKKNLNINEFMRIFEEEQKRRGRFYNQARMGFPGKDPRFGLLNRNRMHKRRRLRPFGFGYEAFPYARFPGHFSPYGPIPYSMRPYSVGPTPPYGPNYFQHPHFGPPFMGPPPFPHPNMEPHSFRHPYMRPSPFNHPQMGYPPMVDNYNNYYNYPRRYETYDNSNEYNDRMQSGYFQQDFSNNYNIAFRNRPDQKNKNKQITNYRPISQNNKKNYQNNQNSNYITHTTNSCRRVENKTQQEIKDKQQLIEQNMPEKKEENLEEEDDEEVLIPDEHPEETTSLEELDEKLSSIKKLLENKNLKEDEKKKLLKLEKLYSQQKNILLDNAEEKEKEEMLKKKDIKLDDYIKEEKEKRKELEEKEEQLIQNELEKNADTKEAATISIVTKPNPGKIFRKQELYKGKEPWKDPLFEPCKENLCPFNEKGWVLPENVLFTDVDGWEKYKWSRVEEILNSKNYQVFEEGISPDDIIQGSIGDCYFLSAIGSLCKFSHYIDKLFFTKEKTKEHLYGVFIYLNAKWKLVLIDDFLPFTGKRFKKFAFSYSGGKELWVAFLEKAWAKINGSYARIGCGGSPTEIFDVLTEALSEQVNIHPDYKDFIWETMYDSEKKGYIMTAGTSADIYNLNLDEVGLCAGHAYTVLGVMEIETDKGVEKVVRLRNPYGNGEFNGDWSDYSKKWTPELKKKYNLVIKDDGDFYMSYNDFLNYYITLGICKLHPGFKTTSLKMVRPTKCQVTKITISKGEVLAYLQLYQKNPRVALKDGTRQKLVYCFLILVDKDFNYIYSVSGANMHIGIEQKLKEGTYYLLSDVNYRYANPNNRNHNYMITCYAEIPLNLENCTDNIDVTKAIQTSIYSYCRQYVPPTQCSNGVYLYRVSTNMDSLPFEAAVFENYTENNYKVKVNINGKGGKKYCFYEDEIVGENETSAIKELNVNSVVVFTVLKYSISSIFGLKYFFAPLKTPSKNTPTLQKAPKIYPEKSTLQPEQPNQQIAGQDQNMENNAQYQPYQDPNMQNNVQYQDNNSQYQPYQDQNIQNNAQYQPYQDPNMQNNAQYQTYQDPNMQNQIPISQEQNMQMNQQNMISQYQNIDSNQQYNQQYMDSQYQNVKNNQQYAPSKEQYIKSNAFIPQQNIQGYNYYNPKKNQLYNNQNIKNNSGFISKNYAIKTSQNIPKKNIQPNINYIPKSHIKSNTQYISHNNYIKKNMEYMNPNIIPQINKNYVPYIQNTPKINTNNNLNNKKTGNPVFRTQGQIIDQKGALVQYSMINGDNLVIGLENRSNMKIRLKLFLKGLVIGNTGKTFAIFYSNPKERKIFNTKILPNYSYEQITFQFQYL